MPRECDGLHFSGGSCCDGGSYSYQTGRTPKTCAGWNEDGSKCWQKASLGEIFCASCAREAEKRAKAKAEEWKSA
jgi:hypothetical protein